MTAQKFRELALKIPGAIEAEHMRHPDFRINGKIFASLGYPDDAHGMVGLTPEQQASMLEREPDVFEHCAGVWGKRGATNVHLRNAKVGVIRVALKAAAQNRAAGRR